MNLNTVGYLIKEGCRSLWTSKKTAIASLIIIFATMLMLGIFVLVSANVENIIKKAEEQQGIMVYIYDCDEEKTNTIKESILNIFSVKSVDYISKEEGLQSLIDQADEQYKVIFEGYKNDSPVSAAFIVKLTNLDQSKNVQNEINKIDGVKNIESKDKTTQGIVNIAKTVNTISMVILVILIIISVFIISNAIKITMYARRKEISIMKYVGATDGFIRFPFIVEGMAIGLFGALISTLVVSLTYTRLYSMYMDAEIATGSVLSGALVPFGTVAGTLILIYVILGVGIGVIGSTMSIKKYLDV